MHVLRRQLFADGLCLSSDLTPAQASAMMCTMMCCLPLPKGPPILSPLQGFSCCNYAAWPASQTGTTDAKYCSASGCWTLTQHVRLVACLSCNKRPALSPSSTAAMSIAAQWLYSARLGVTKLSQLSLGKAAHSPKTLHTPSPGSATEDKRQVAATWCTLLEQGTQHSASCCALWCAWPNQARSGQRSARNERWHQHWCETTGTNKAARHGVS